MKRTIKTICLIALLAITSVNIANAQLGIQAGYVNSSFSDNTVNSAFRGNNFNGFEIGATYDFLIQSGVYLNFGLLYTHLAKSEDISVINYKSTGHFLNVPVRVGYRYQINNAWRVFGYAGPNFTFGLAGKTTPAILSDSNWYVDDGQKRFDIKLGLGVGVQWNNIALKGGYDWGLINTNKVDILDTNRNQFNISLAYMFNLGY